MEVVYLSKQWQLEEVYLSRQWQLVLDVPAIRSSLVVMRDNYIKF